MSELTIVDVSTNDPIWALTLNHITHDTYHRPEYVAASALVDAGFGRAVIVKAQGCTLVLPYIKRNIPNGQWDAISPYGYGGPVITPDTNTEAFSQLLTIALQYLMNQGCTSFFLRSHPGINTVWPEIRTGRVVKEVEGQTVVVDLGKTPEELWKLTASGHRSEINRAKRLGYTCEIDTEFAWYSQFINLYRTNMREIGADSYYSFSDGYFSEIKGGLGEKLLLVVALREGELAGGSLFMVHENWVHYHLSATSPLHRSRSPSKIIIDSARTYFGRQGFSWLHLGGGRGGVQDSLMNFKAGFSPIKLNFHATGVILDSKEYQRLASKSEFKEDDEFFPIYRKPSTPRSKETKC